jgi:hypothetical protein
MQGNALLDVVVLPHVPNVNSSIAQLDAVGAVLQLDSRVSHVRCLGGRSGCRGVSHDDQAGPPEHVP